MTIVPDLGRDTQPLGEQDESPVEVVVTERIEVADRVVEFALQPVDDEQAWRRYPAGSHIDLLLPNGEMRQYSLVSDHAAGAPLRFAVLKADDSRGGSRLLHERLRPGHRLRVGAVKNTFALDETARRSVLIAGGIGITPLVSMARRLGRLGREVEVHYRARTAERAAYLGELQDAVGRDHVHLVTGGDRNDGRFDPVEIARSAPGATVYVCGPESFMEFVRRGALAAGVAEDRIREEHFKHEVLVGGPPFSLTAARSGVTVTVGSDEVASDVLRDAGVFVPTACGQGVCGTCVVRVLDGIPDHRDIYLSPAQKRAGDRMTLCCSRALTESLTVDI